MMEAEILEVTQEIQKLQEEIDKMLGLHVEEVKNTDSIQSIIESVIEGKHASENEEIDNDYSSI